MSSIVLLLVTLLLLPAEPLPLSTWTKNSATNRHRSLLLAIRDHPTSTNHPASTSQCQSAGANVLYGILIGDCSTNGMCNCPPVSNPGRPPVS
jgi:hypothetical protein